MKKQGLTLICLVLFIPYGCGRQVPPNSNQSKATHPTSTPELLQAAELKLRQKEYSGAQDLLKLVLSREPQNYQALYLVAQCYVAAKQVDSALQALKLIPDDHPQAGIHALKLSVDIALAAKRLDVAEKGLQRVLELHGNVALFLRQLGMLLNDQGRRFEASKFLLELARGGHINEYELLALGTLSEPFHSEDRQQDLRVGDNVVMSDLAEAKSLFIQDRFQESRTLVEKLLVAFPTSTPVAAFAGRVFAIQIDDARLRAWLSECPPGIEREPEYWEALGIWLQALDRHREAARCFAETVRRDQTDAQAYLRFSQSLTASQNISAAKIAEERYRQLRRLAEIAFSINFEGGKPQELHETSEILDKLHRPWEALGWRIALAQRNGNVQTLAASFKAQAEAAKRSESAMRLDWLSCDLDLAEWPLPDLSNLCTAAKPKPREIATIQIPIRLVDVASEVGLNFKYQNNKNGDVTRMHLYDEIGGGIAVIDYDLDGWYDVYFGQAGGVPYAEASCGPNQLFRNQLGKKFSNVSGLSKVEDRGYTLGVSSADLNQDGLPDLLVANIGLNAIYYNNGDGTFRKEKISDNRDWTSGFVVADLTGDHLPDIVEINYVADARVTEIPCWGENFNCNPQKFTPATNRYLYNTGTEFSAWHDVPAGSSYGFAGIAADFDRAFGNDVFIACDTVENIFWFSKSKESNSRSWVLEDRAGASGTSVDPQGDPQGSMGIAAGDFDRDGNLDLHVTNYRDEAVSLLLQKRPGFFVDAAVPYGLAEPSDPMVGFGTQAVDFDRDGWLDLAVLNGHVESRPDIPFKMKPQLFRGTPNRFELIEPSEAGPYWDVATLGRTLAILDWNGDGRPDLVGSHLDIPACLLQNETSTKNWVRFELVGTKSERDAIGAEIKVKCGEDVWTGWVLGGDGFQCTNEPVVDIGIADHTWIDSVHVRWPSGLNQKFDSLSASTEYLIVEGNDSTYVRKP